MSRCTKCKKAFRKHGRSSYCRPCTRVYLKEYYQRNKTKILSNSREKYQEGSHLFWRAKLGSLKLAKEFSDLYDKDPHCFYCRKFLHATETHVDHKVPKTRGGKHGIDNLVVACADCNHLKHTRTDKEFKEFLVGYLTRFFGNEAEAANTFGGHRERLSELTPEKEDATVCSHEEMNRERLAETTNPTIH